MSLVLDHSVALAWRFEDEQTPAVMDLLDRVAETGAVTTLLWPLEALNGLLAAERRRRLDPAYGSARAEAAARAEALALWALAERIEHGEPVAEKRDHRGAVCPTA